MAKAMFGPHKIPFYVSSNEVILSPGHGDTGAIPPEYFQTVLELAKKKAEEKYLHQAPFDYICVYDFECQCTQGDELKFNEIIEFPIVVVDVKNRKVVAEFQTYVKPVIEPKLTDFCTELTGITQDQVDKGVILQEALKQVHTFLKEKQIIGSEFVFASCGDFDGNQLKRESQHKNLNIANYYKRWINLKKVFELGEHAEPWDNPNRIKKEKPHVKGMEQMLQ